MFLNATKIIFTFLSDCTLLIIQGCKVVRKLKSRSIFIIDCDRSLSLNKWRAKIEDGISLKLNYTLLILDQLFTYF